MQPKNNSEYWFLIANTSDISKWRKESTNLELETIKMKSVIYVGLIYSLIVLIGSNDGTVSNSTISFFFTADPQFGWGSSYSGNEERYILSYKFRILSALLSLLIMYRKYLILPSNIFSFQGPANNDWFRSNNCPLYRLSTGNSHCWWFNYGWAKETCVQIGVSRITVIRSKGIDFYKN